jgi:TPP-dependent pyruvate/acetoin dehydrogenase alpha subunit
VTNSRNKGKRFELLVTGLFKAIGYEARRGQQYSGANGDADIVGVPGIHIECKAVEKLNLYDAMAQAKHDAREGELPVVIHKKNNCAVLVTMEFETWAEMYREWELSRKENEQ